MGIFGLVLLLIVLAGVIAFAGDRLGTFVGRHRLSLFGARPRRTGQIVGVFAGILIMLTTLGVLALANRNATATLLNAQQAARELTELQAEQRVLQAMVRDLERDLEDGADQLTSARDELADVTDQRDTAQAEVEQAAAALDELLSEQSFLESELLELQANMVEMSGTLEELQINLQMAQQQLEQAAQRQAIAENEAARAQAEADTLRAETADLTALIEELGIQAADLETQAGQLRNQNELLQGENEALGARNDELAVDNSRLIDQNTLLGEVNENLRQRFEDSNTRVLELEGNLQVLELAMEDSSRRLVELQDEFEQIAAGELAYRTDDLIYSGRVQAGNPAAAREELAAFVRAANEVTARRGAGNIQLSTAQFDSLANLVAQSDDELVIALISPRNQLRSAAVEVSIEAWENSQVLAGGHLLSSRVLHLGSAEQPAAQSDVRAGLNELVRSTRSRLTRAGFFSQDAPQFSDSEDAFLTQLERLDGRVVVGVLTREPVFRGGPAALEFVILN